MDVVVGHGVTCSNFRHAVGEKAQLKVLPPPLYTHLGTEPQPLIGRLYVICYYEEHLLTLQNKIRSRQ